MDFTLLLLLIVVAICGNNRSSNCSCGGQQGTQKYQKPVYTETDRHLPDLSALRAISS
jgi:hypothetical protein